MFNKKYLAIIITLSLFVMCLSFGIVRQTSTLDSVNKQFSFKSTEIIAIQEQFTTVQAELTVVQSQLAATNEDLKTANDNLISTKEQLTSLKTSDYLLKDQIYSLQDNISNLKTNYDRQTAGYGYVFRDPTYYEVKAFITSDNTDLRKYDINSYNCVNFSADLIKNAAGKNIRCGFVDIAFADSGHAIIVFNTTDKGLIFIEPQGDEEVDLKIGKKYWTSLIVPPQVHMSAPSYDDTVLRYTIVW
jgi:hypothetical protein